ncbi:alginate lyase family protein [Halomicrobium sp. IBSBa]|nr:alginate lyase family protein [Halomicrobium sp. IBSBa]
MSLTFDPHTATLDRLRQALPESHERTCRQASESFAAGEITFLNRTRSVSDPATVRPDDERIESLPRLWYLKLAGFEPVEWLVLGFDEPSTADGVAETIQTWLHEFAVEHPIGARPGYLRGAWTPYAVCHRILNLCLLGAWAGGLDEQLSTYLYKNLSFLSRNVERDVGGNHLVENGIALVAGGLAVSSPDTSFCQQGLDVLKQVTEQQFLSDGYHYERSPMYHLAVTDRLLLAVSLLSAGPADVPEWLRTTAEDAVAFIEHVTGPDGEIALLNDAVYGETHTPATYRRLADRLDLTGTTTPELDASGIVRRSLGPLSLLLDAGDSGPSGQLGHVHNDPATVLLWHENRPVLTDTGTFDYSPGERRRLARSVESHNTAAPRGVEPVTFGGRFLMDEPIETEVARTDQPLPTVTVRYETNGTVRYEHTRTLVEGPRWWLVHDAIDAPVDQIVSRLHTAPSIKVSIESAVSLRDGDRRVCVVTPSETAAVQRLETKYFPAFGVEQERVALELSSADTVSFFVSRQPLDRARVESADGSVSRIVVDGQEWSL